MCENNYLPVVKSSLIAEAIEGAAQIVKNLTSQNSIKAFGSDLTYWNAWYKANDLDNSVIKKEHVILFIMQHAHDMPDNVHSYLVSHKFKSNSKKMHMISTIKRRLASLSRYLQINKFENPCTDKEILILLRKLIEKNGCSKPWGKAMTVEILNNILNTCENDLLGIRDYSLILFGFSTGGRRRSEIASATMENLIKISDGNFIYNLGKSKTNKTGELDPKPVAGRAATALSRWIEMSNIKDGPLFRGIYKGNKKIMDKPISTKQISRIIKNRCKKAGYDPDLFTAHSLRSGFVTEGGKKGKPIGDIMSMTGHRSYDQVMKYYQSGSVLNNSAACLAG